MTRRDFVLIAAALDRARQRITNMPEYHGWLLCVKETTAALETTNDRFDVQRFITACGVQDADEITGLR